MIEFFRALRAGDVDPFALLVLTVMALVAVGVFVWALVATGSVLMAFCFVGVTAVGVLALVAFIGALMA